MGRAATVEALSTGRAATLEHGRRPLRTAFHKTPVDHPLRLGRLGLPGDEHVYRHHGGPHQAVCVYPREHYAHWAGRYDLELPAAAAFGENFTTTGLVETEVRLGDVFTVGAALVQVTGPRAPCVKIAARYDRPRMAVDLQRSGFTGYLLRVLAEGDVAAGDVMEFVRGEGDGVTVAEANRIVGAKRDTDGAARLLAGPALPADLEAAMRQRLARHAGSG